MYWIADQRIFWYNLEWNYFLKTERKDNKRKIKIRKERIKIIQFVKIIASNRAYARTVKNWDMLGKCYGIILFLFACHRLLCMHMWQ